MKFDDWTEEEIKTPKTKMKCHRCEWFNYNLFTKQYEDGESFCGVPGREHVEPDGPQQNLDGRGSCSFTDKKKPPKQLSLFDLLNQK